ncbi:Z1 domain-containing protein [Rhodococcoides corynebacterioides]|uniref:Z1 domain-containing protein n=1 Tax=Rhodococcoides corynebacterioides TaxID=53972 RepID=UPI001C9ACA50|nr:Z1 domain-containing protein [Rhodococcus corynebacterioides]MBY6363258.1 Z1 domain-containing protein [Rhodococcus corynebacterioides]
MSDTASISQPLKNVLQGLSDQRPVPLLPTVSMFAGHTVTEAELVDFVWSADPNDGGLIQLRLALAKWDASAELTVQDDADSSTEPSTPERRRAVVRELGLSDSTESKLAELIPIHIGGEIVISKTFEPWYDKARRTRSTLYWDDYEKYLTEVKNWPASLIAGLDRSTTSVVERLTDPTRSEVKSTKGLVVGYVQSGKTANFTGVAAKAIDAGYRLVIIMTGTIEILRSQTQRRIDMELMGVENVLAGQDASDPAVARNLDYQQDEEWLAGNFVRHSQQALDQPGATRIRRVTTHKNDYKNLPQGLSQLRYDRVDKRKPLNDPVNLNHVDAYVVVVKKNSSPLKKLIGDLKPIQSGLAELPALIIDDESDLASVNTKDPKKSAERTAINKLIREVMEVVPRAQYVGYTATPFANVFIDPDDDSDLFPSDFVLSLPRPAGYMGVQEFHDIDIDWDLQPRSVKTSNELAFIRAIKGDPATDPGNQKKELAAALDSWVLSGAIKKYREKNSGRVFRHHTMLIHESVKNAAHEEAADIVRELWSIGRFGSSAGLSRLEALFDKDYDPVMRARAGEEPVPPSFDVLKSYIGEALAEMTSGGADPVLIVNSDDSVQQQQEALDFDKGKVWRVLVGGAKLSRGFTVEGLTISFFRRKAGQADTLMQAGRWFGFRAGYTDLVRLFIRRDDKVDLYEAFEALLLDEESFRDELTKYVGVDEDGRPIVEPRQIPPLVSQHLPWLKPSARTKMFNAVVQARSSVGTFHQLSSVPSRNERRKHALNLSNALIPMLRNATTTVDLPYVDSSTGKPSSQPALVGIIDANKFLALFETMTWHPEYLDVINPLKKWITGATEDGRIQDWAVIWPQARTNTDAGFVELEELGVRAPVWKRKRREGQRIDFTGENKRNILAAEAVPRGEEADGLGRSQTRGALVISLVDDRAVTDTSPTRGDITGLLSLRAPDKAVRSKRGLIQYGVLVKAKGDDVSVEKVDGPAM